MWPCNGEGALTGVLTSALAHPVGAQRFGHDLDLTRQRPPGVITRPRPPVLRDQPAAGRLVQLSPGRDAPVYTSSAGQGGTAAGGERDGDKVRAGGPHVVHDQDIPQQRRGGGFDSSA